MDAITRLARQTGLPEETLKALVQERADAFTADLSMGAPAAGTPISLSDAARRYQEKPDDTAEFSRILVNLSAWAKRGRIRILKPAPSRGVPILVDERDVFFAIQRYRNGKGRGRRPLSGFAGAPA